MYGGRIEILFVDPVWTRRRLRRRLIRGLRRRLRLGLRCLRLRRRTRRGRLCGGTGVLRLRRRLRRRARSRLHRRGAELGQHQFDLILGHPAHLEQQFLHAQIGRVLPVMRHVHGDPIEVLGPEESSLLRSLEERRIVHES